MLRQMHLSRILLALVVATTSLFAHADMAPIKYVRLPGLVLSTSKLVAAGISRVSAKKLPTGELVYQLADENGKILRNYIIGKTSPEYLKEFAPSKIRDSVNYLKHNAGKIALNKLKHLPAEAFSFFMALGAISVYNVVFNYNDNPVAVDQFLTGQKDPVGQLSFGAFMVGSGLTADPLMAVAESKGAKYFIPYLGMMNGMIASHIATEVLHALPIMGKCAAEIAIRGAQEYRNSNGANEKLGDVCDDAYKAWQNFDIREKGNEMVPSLFAMMGASAISGGIEWTLAKAAAVGIKGARARIFAAAIAATPEGLNTITKGVELFMTFTEAGLVVKVGKWAYKTAQLVTFTVAQTTLEAPFVFSYKNVWEIGPELWRADHRIGALVANKFSNGWREETGANVDGFGVCKENQNDHCYRDLDRELEDLQETMDKWREANMNSVLTKFLNWSMKLQTLTSQYRYARTFYKDFVQDMWLRKFKYSNKQPVDMVFPLYGVLAKGLKPDDYGDFLESPDSIVEMQLMTVADVVAWIEANKNSVVVISGNPETDKTRETMVKELPAELQAAYNQIVSGLQSGDPTKIGLALKELRYRLYKDPSPVMPQTSSALIALLQPIYKMLGQPNPMLEPGQGYLKLIVWDPSNQNYKKSPFPHMAPKTGEPFEFQSGPEYLIYKMIMGPDAENNQSSIQVDMSGFPATVEPPQIRLPGTPSYQFAAPDLKMPHSLANSLFAMQNFTVNGQGGGSIVDYLKDGIRPSVLGDAQNGSAIEKWWDLKMDGQLSSALLIYQTKYEDIIQEFYQKLFGTPESKGLLKLDGKWTNQGPFSSEILYSIEQERNIYLYILDSYYKSTQKMNWNRPVRQDITHWNWNYLVPTREVTHFSVLDSTGANFSTKTEWIQAMNKEWANARALLARLAQKPVRKVEVSKDGAKESKKVFIVSRVTNKELEDQVGKLDGLLREYPGLEKMTPFQMKVVTMALQGIKSTQHQLMDFAKVINNVSYVENYNGEALKEPVKQSCIKKKGQSESNWLKSQYQGCVAQ